MASKQEILSGFDRIAKQRFGEAAHVEFSPNDNNVILIFTEQTTADANDISRFNTSAGSHKCWVISIDGKIVICREV